MSFSITQEELVILVYALFMGLGGWVGFKK